MVFLKYCSDLMSAESSLFPAVKTAYIFTVIHVYSRIKVIVTGHNIKKCGLTTAAVSHHGQKIAVSDFQIKIVQRFYGLRTSLVAFADVYQFNH